MVVDVSWFQSVRLNRGIKIQKAKLSWISASHGTVPFHNPEIVLGVKWILPGF